MSSTSLPKVAITRRDGVSLPLLRKRTRSNKLHHKQILGAVPFEMVPAWDERKSIRYGGINKRTDPIGHLLLKYEFSPESELVEVMCRACAQEQFDESIWDTISLRIEDLTETLNPVDAGIVMKTVILYTLQNPAKESLFAPAVLVMLRKLASRRTSSDAIGSYTLLYGLQALNHFRDHIDQDTLSRYFSHFLSRIVRGDRVSALHTTALINFVQAIANRPGYVKLSPSSIDAFLEELIVRVSQSSPATVPERDPPDVDGWFGLISACAKLPLTLPKLQHLFNASKSLLFANDNQYLNLLTFEQLAGTVHAYSRLGPASLSGHSDVFQSIGNILVDENFHSKWNPRISATTINAYGTAAVLHGDLIALFAKNTQVRSVFESMEPLQISMCVHGISKLGLSRKFSWLLNKAEQLIPEMNLHSVVKIITSVNDDSVRHSVREKVVNSAFSRALEIFKREENQPDIDSTIALLKLALEKKDDMCLQVIRAALPILSCNIGKLNDFSKVSNFVHDVSVGLGKEKAVVDFITALIGHIHAKHPNLSLNEYIKIVYGLSVVAEPSADLREQIQAHLRCRGNQITTLSFRPLSRLSFALSRLTITDMDLVELIQERYKELNS